MKNLALFLLLTLAIAQAQSLTNLPTETLLNNGPSSSKIDIVFVGDGFSREQRPAFRSDVHSVLSELWKVTPFKELKSEFNVHLVHVDAKSAGWGSNGQRVADFPFGSEKPHGGSDMVELKYPDRVDQALKNAPQCDVPIVITRLEGRSHAGRHIVLAESAKLVLAHELGHNLASLGDEYTSSRRTADRERRPLPSGRDLPQPNLTLTAFIDPATPETIANTAKWGHFLNLPDGDVVSAYQGGYYRVMDVWRPTNICVMSRSADLLFCPVCHEELYKAILKKNGKRFDHDRYHQSFPLSRWRSRGSGY